MHILIGLIVALGGSVGVTYLLGLNNELAFLNGFLWGSIGFLISQYLEGFKYGR